MMKTKIAIGMLIPILLLLELAAGYSFHAGNTVNHNVGQITIGFRNTQNGVNLANVLGLSNRVNQNCRSSSNWRRQYSNRGLILQMS